MQRPVGCRRATLWSFQHLATAAVLGSLYSLNAIFNLVLVDDGGQLIVAYVDIKSFEFRVVAVYVLVRDAPFSSGGRHSLTIQNSFSGQLECNP